ncbi:DUF917 domain-containing protein [Pseudolysinimonas sp.]|uniref:DUF917 domain-containing protein n=1 Tax=Pseudolysinimonas sp. TaxID=2680009 RepID=UPI003784030A
MTTSIRAEDIAPLAAGCAIFGTGGGGSVHNIQLSVERALAENGPVELVTVDDLGPDDTVLLLSGIGAPAVGIEMLSSATQVSSLLAEAERYLGRRVTTFMAAEIGGGNGIVPVGWAARFGRKVLDADGMGRAFPLGTMVSMNVVGVPCEFGMLADVVGNVTLMRTVDIPWLERNARAIAITSGGMAISAHYPLTAETARGSLVEGTVSRAIEVGRALLGAAAPIAALTESLGAAALIGGKLIDVERRTVEGFTRGVMTIEGTGDDRGRVVVLEVQNENLVALERGQVLASVPDLITIVDTETGEAISTELLRFGQRVTVLAWACDPIWRTPRGLELTGPAAFGYDNPYVPFDLERSVR